MRVASSTNRVREALAAGRFLISVEFASPVTSQPFDDAIRPVLTLARAVRDDPRVDAIALTDRSRSDHDHDPIAIARRIVEEGGPMPIVHLAGKDRSLKDLEADLQRAESLDLDTFLLVTGDALRHPPADRPVRYLDAVHALCAARQRPGAFLLAAALCPFKYREEELVNQYLKAGKKLRAGADVLITQMGWDMRKFQEARWVLHQRGYHAPLIAGLLFLTPRVSRRIRRGGLPGVQITADLARKLEEEAHALDGGYAAAYRRLALQIVGVRHQGYAGVQLSGLRTYPKIARLLEEVEAIGRAHPTLEDWWQAWEESLTMADGRRARVAPESGLYLAPDLPGNGAHPPRGEYVQYRAMDVLDHIAFREGSPGDRVLGTVIRGLDDRFNLVRALLPVETAIKAPLLGCQQCGFCRLPHTAYVCPETCPKGLANGPCGGSQDNLCEFGDRECIHSRIYRLSKSAGRLADLEEVLIPPVPEETRGSSSWVAHFRGDSPRAVRLERRRNGHARETDDVDRR